MKRSLILFFLITVANSIFSQDLIVKNDGDSINCKITKVKAGNVYFTFVHRNEIRNTLIHLSNVEDYKYGYYQISDLYEEDVDKYEGNAVRYNDYQHFRFAVNGGYSYMTAKIDKSVPADFKKYVKEMKTGYHFGGDISYYFSESLGVGGKCYIFKTSNSLDDVYLEDLNGYRRYGKMSDDMTITFIGPLFSTRLLNWNKRNAFLMNLSLGYMGHSKNAVLIDKYKITGSTVGISFDIGYDIGLSKNFSLGFQLSFLSGTMDKYNLSNGGQTETIKLEKGKYENLSRIDFSVGLRFNR